MSEKTAPEEPSETYEQRWACVTAALPVLARVKAVAWLARENTRRFRGIALRLRDDQDRWQAVHDDVVDHVASGWGS